MGRLIQRTVLKYLNSSYKKQTGTYNAFDEVEVLGHHVVEVIGDEDSTHEELRENKFGS